MWSHSETSTSRAQAQAEGVETHYEPHVSGVLLRMLADVVRKFGVAPTALLPEGAPDAFGREPIDLRMPLSEFRALSTRAVELTSEPALGLYSGLHASESAFDVLAPLVAHVPTLRQAIESTRRFSGLAFEGLRLELSECTGVGRLSCEIPRGHDESDRFLTEMVMAGFRRMLQAFGCTGFELHTTRFEYARPAHASAYATAFDGTERFQQSFTGFEFAADLLDRPHLHANPALHAVVHGQCEQRLDQLARPLTLIERLRLYLSSQGPSMLPDMESAGRALGLSGRSLRRHLAQEGTSYRHITRDLQRERAYRLLRDPERTLQSIAHTLGFSDAASFHRAFKRWTGRTAGEYRASCTTAAQVRRSSPPT